MEFSGEVHPLASDYPMIGADELADLADSIKQQGQLDPITLDPDGVLLDGRNRLAACEMAGVEPKFEVFDGDPVAFIVGKNATRRQLSSGQRAMAIAIGMWESGAWNHETGSWKRDGTVSNFATAKIASSADLAMCGAVLAHSRDTAREVLAGSANLRNSYSDVLRKRKAAEKRAEALDLLREKAPDLLRLVQDESLELDEAVAAYEKRYADEIAAREAAISAWNRAVDGLTQALAYFNNGMSIPNDIPSHRPDVDEFNSRLEQLNNKWKEVR